MSDSRQISAEAKSNRLKYKAFKALVIKILSEVERKNYNPAESKGGLPRCRTACALLEIKLVAAEDFKEVVAASPLKQ